jgi:allantoicase
MVSHIRITMFPDGGIMRVKVLGKGIAPIGKPLDHIMEGSHSGAGSAAMAAAAAAGGGTGAVPVSETKVVVKADEAFQHSHMSRL